MNEPSKSEVIEHLREHYGLTLAQVVRIMNSPLHPHTLRDHFAGVALQGYTSKFGASDYKNLASYAYKQADAMLAERLKEK